jgi:hypothetical protein
LMRSGSEPGVAVGREVAEKFLGHLRDGRPDAAWDSTTAEFKSTHGKESFVRATRPVKHLRQPLEFVSSLAVQVGDAKRSKFVFRASSGEMVRIVIGCEDNDWKVDRWVR